jgi:myosin heavy subunit
MSVVGLSDQEQKNILQIVSAILHLGNISFVEDRSNFASVHDERCKKKKQKDIFQTLKF